MKEKSSHLKPFLSVVVIIISFMFIVFVQMEERRMGYEVFRLSKAHRIATEQNRLKKIELAKLTRPQNIERMAQSKLSLRRVQPNQIIHLTGVSN